MSHPNTRSVVHDREQNYDSANPVLGPCCCYLDNCDCKIPDPAFTPKAVDLAPSAAAQSALTGLAVPVIAGDWFTPLPLCDHALGPAAGTRTGSTTLARNGVPPPVGLRGKDATFIFETPETPVEYEISTCAASALTNPFNTSVIVARVEADGRLGDRVARCDGEEGTSEGVGNSVSATVSESASCNHACASDPTAVKMTIGSLEPFTRYAIVVEGSNPAQAGDFELSFTPISGDIRAHTAASAR